MISLKWFVHKKIILVNGYIFVKMKCKLIELKVKYN